MGWTFVPALGFRGSGIDIPGCVRGPTCDGLGRGLFLGLMNEVNLFSPLYSKTSVHIELSSVEPT